MQASPEGLVLWPRCRAPGAVPGVAALVGAPDHLVQDGQVEVVIGFFRTAFTDLKKDFQRVFEGWFERKTQALHENYVIGTSGMASQWRFIYLRRDQLNCDHKTGMCTFLLCFQAWDAQYPFIDFSCTEAGRKYRHEMQKYSTFTAKYKERT